MSIVTGSSPQFEEHCFRPPSPAVSPGQTCPHTPRQATFHSTESFFVLTGRQADGEATGLSTCPEIAIAPIIDEMVEHEFQKPACLINNSSVEAVEWVSVNKSRRTGWLVDC